MDSSDSISPVERLLIALSRVWPEPQPPKDWFEGIDGDQLLWLAARRTNYCLVMRRYLDLAPQVSQPLRERIERNLWHFEVKERFTLADVKELARGLSAKGEPVMLLKGAAFGRYIYPRRGLRHFRDIDVLIRKTALPHAVDILREIGYRKEHEIDGSVDMARRLGGTSPSAVIELHTELMHDHEYPYYRAELAYDEEELLARGEERDLDGARVVIMRPVDELFYSVLHFFYHHDLAGLKYHSDLNALLGDPRRPLDIEEAIEMAHRVRAGFAVGLALLIQQSVFGDEAVPTRMVRALAPSGPRLAAIERLLPPFWRVALSEGRVAGHPVKVLVAPGLAAPSWLAFRWFFPGKRYLMAFYHVSGEAWRATYHVRYSAAILKKALWRRDPSAP